MKWSSGLLLAALLTGSGCREAGELEGRTPPETDSGVIDWKSGEGDFSEYLAQLAERARGRELTLRIQWHDKARLLRVRTLSHHQGLSGSDTLPTLYHIRRDGWKVGQREILGYPHTPHDVARQELLFVLGKEIHIGGGESKTPAMLLHSSRLISECWGMLQLVLMRDAGVELMILPDQPLQPPVGHPLLPLAAKIGKVLPTGWSMVVGPDEIVIERDEPIHGCELHPGMFDPMPGEEETTDFWFAIRSMGPMTPEQYAAIKQRNEDLERQGNALYREARINDIPHDIDKTASWNLRYHPRNPVEAMAVSRYKDIYRQIRMLPDLHLHHHSYRLDYPGGGFSFGDEGQHRECLKVFERVSGLLFRFDYGPSPEEEPDPMRPPPRAPVSPLEP